VATVATPVTTFARVALLTDAAPSDPYLFVNEFGVGDMASLFHWHSGLIEPAINQVDAATNDLVTNRTFGGPARGVYVSNKPYPWNPALSDYVLLSGGNAPSIPVLTLVPSLISF
jgi:hypothetical protein